MPSHSNANKKKTQSSWTNTQPGSNKQTRLMVNAELFREAQQTAHGIVLNLLEVDVSKEYFVDKIRYITSEHYNDVVTERSIAGTCGYPLCNVAFLHIYENQSYIIRQNQVYDVTHRRHFCSDKCYEASELVLEQVPSSPLYLRSNDTDMKNFKLLLPDLTKLKGRYGSLVNITGASDILKGSVGQLDSSCHTESAEKTNPKKSQDLNFSDTTHESSSSRSKDSSVNLFTTDEETSLSKTNDSNTSFGLSPSQSFPLESSTMSTDSEAYLSEEAQKLNLDDSSTGTKPLPSEEPSRLIYRSDGKPRIQRGKGCVKESDQNKRGNEACAQSPLGHIYEVERTMRGWITFESLRMILGDNYVKGMLEELGKVWQDYDTTAGLRLGTESKLRYIALCRENDAEERREKIFHATDSLGDPEDIDKKQSELQPLPNYEQLKTDVEKSSLMIKAFYEGRELVESCENNLETIYEEGNGPIAPTHRKKSGKKEEEDIDSVTLPLIDAYSHEVWRRRIVLEKLNKPMSRFALECGLDEKEILRLVTSLVATFDISPHISFQMKQWKLIGLTILKMLSVRYSVIENTITPDGTGFDHVMSVLRGEGLDSQYLDRLLSYLTEISYILTKYHNDKEPSHRSNDAASAGEGSTRQFGGDSCLETKGRAISSEGKPPPFTSTDTNIENNFIDAGFRQDKSNKPYTNLEELD